MTEMNATEIRSAAAVLRKEAEPMLKQGSPRALRNAEACLKGARVGEALAAIIGDKTFTHRSPTFLMGMEGGIDGSDVQVNDGSAEALVAAYQAAGETPPENMGKAIASWHRVYG